MLDVKECKLRKENEEKDEILFLRDKNKLGMLKLKDIENITYCSLKRECEVHLCDGNIFCIKKKFSDIEKIQDKCWNFIKIERGTIINLAQIQSLNFKNSRIIFKSGTYLYINKQKLKQLEESLFNKCDGFYL